MIKFVGKDVTDVLKYQNGSRDINRHVDDEDKADVVIHDGRQNRNMTIINESGLYSLILSSKLPKAKEFKRWVTSEVLPSIRQTGGYGSDGALVQAAVEQMAAVMLTQMPIIISETVKAVLNATGGMSRQGEDLEAKDGLTLSKELLIFPQNKIEAFPADVRNLIDGLLHQMKEEENLNFSLVARLCTLKGHSVTSPTVKRYYDKKFNRS